MTSPAPGGPKPGRSCPTTDQLRRYLDDELDAEAVAPIEGHIEICLTCQETLESIVVNVSAPTDPPDPLLSTYLDRLKQLDPRRSTVDGGTEVAVTVVDVAHEQTRFEPMPGASLTTDRGQQTLADGANGGVAGRIWPEMPGFVIVGELGRGGMGIVYLARQVGLNREVALKMILSPDQSEGAAARFRAEAEAIARLQHSHVVQVYAVGEHAGRPFLAMEYVPGGTLASQLDGTPWVARRAAELVVAIAHGIHEAHRVGVVHRDLKPSNVLIARDGTPKIADFGLAKLIDGDSELTRSGVLLGSPSYMAPEQAAESGGPVGPAADIHAVGSILYELTTGRPPYRAATVLETLELVRRAEPTPPSRLVPGLPRDLETIALKCLEKAPSRRYASASELAADLGRWSSGEPIMARRSPFWERAWKAARRRPYQAALIVLAQASLAIVLGVLAWSNARIGDALEVARLDRLDAVAAKAESDRLAGSEASARAGAARRSAGLALDKGVLLAESGRVGRGLLWMNRAYETAAGLDDSLRRAARASLADWGRRATRPRTVVDLGMRSFNLDFRPELGIAAIAGDQRPAVLDLATLGEVATFPREMDWKLKTLLSGDGRRLASTDGKLARVWELPSGALVREFPIRSPKVNPDDLAIDRSGLRVALRDYIDSSLWLWDLSGEAPEVRQVMPGVRFYAPAFSPDGRLLAALEGERVVRVWDARTLSQVRVFPARAEPSRVEFLPDGSGLVIFGIQADATVSVYDLDKDRPRFHGSIHTAVTGLAFRPDSRALLIGGRDGSIRLLDASSGEPLGPVIHAESPVLASNSHSETSMGVKSAVALSPDGRTILSTHADATARTWDVATGRAIGSILEHPAVLVGAGFGADGRTILTVSGDGQVISWDLAEGPVGRPLTQRTDLGMDHGEVSPDGQLVVAMGRYQPFATLVDVATGFPRSAPLLHNGRTVRVASFNRDGSLLATGGDDRQVRLWETATGRAIDRRIDSEHWPTNLHFTPDGRTLLAMVATTEMLAWDVSTGSRLGLSEPTPGSFDGGILLISPDGRFVVTRTLDDDVLRWEIPTLRRLGDSLRASLAANREGPSLKARPSEITPFALSPDGATLWLIETTGAGGPRAVVRRDPLTWRSIGDPIGRDISSAVLSSDGRRVVTVSGTTARQYDATTGAAIGAALDHPSTVQSIAISPDGATVATGAFDGGLRFWDSATGRPIGPPRPHPDPVHHIRFVGDGASVATFVDHPTFWNVPRPLADDPPRIAAWVRAVSLMELDEDGDSTRRLDPAAWRRLRADSGGKDDDAPVSATEWHERSATRFALQGQASAALWHLDRLLALRPDDATALLRRDRALAGMGETARAAADESRAAALAPASTAALKAWMAFDRLNWPDWASRPAESMADLARLLSARPDQFQYRSRRADLLLLAGRRAEAEVELGKGLRSGPDVANVLQFARREAILTLDRGDLALYRSHCARFRFGEISWMPDELKGLLLWILVLGDDGDPERDVRLTMTVFNSYPDAEKWQIADVLGATLYRAGRYSEAAERLAEALGPDRAGAPQAWAFLAMTHQRLGDQATARSWLDRLRGWRPEGTLESLWNDMEINLLRREAITTIHLDPVFPSDPFRHD